MVAPELEVSTSVNGVTAATPARGRPLLELSVGYALILATIWTPRPLQHWLYWVSVAYVLATTVASFPGWAAMGFRRGGLLASMWVVLVALMVSIAAVIVARHLNTLRHPISARGWLMTFGGYTFFSFVQQFLLQGYFLSRLLRILPSREGAALAAAGIFAAAHLPNPILTPITLLWGLCACFVFLRCRNVYSLGLAHAILGITVAVTIPGPVVHNMRVGLGYLRYHAPRPHPPRTGMAAIAPDLRRKPGCSISDTVSHFPTEPVRLDTGPASNVPTKQVT